MKDFDATVRNYQGWLGHHAARRCVRLGIDPEEAMQEAWLLIWNNWAAVATAERPGGLMKKLLDQAITAIWRNAHRLKRGRGATGCALDDWDAAVPATQEAAFELKQAAARVEKLPPLLRDTLVDHVMGDQLREIADREGVSYQAIGNRVMRARALLTA